jgi:hypothetical protein
LRSQDGASSVYTREQVSVFYAVTRNIWEKPGIKVEDRNAAVLQYFNEERMLKGLKPVTLEDIMNEVVARNDVFLAAMNATSSRKTGNDEYDSMVKETMAQQNEREKEGSPTSQIPHLIMEALVEQVYSSLNVPNPADI